MQPYDRLCCSLIRSSRVVIYSVPLNIKNRHIHTLFSFRTIPIPMDIINGFIFQSEMHKLGPDTTLTLSTL